MTGDGELQRLKEQAEKLVAQSVDVAPEPSTAGFRQLIHNLRVHQVELEMQNEELRASRNELEQARDAFALLYNQSPVGYLSLDESGLIRKANRTFLQLVGEPDGDVKGAPFSDFLIDEDRQVFLGRFSAIYRQPTDKHVNLRLRSGHGSVTVRRSARREDDGKALLVAVIDISEQARAEAGLRDAEHLWSQTFEAMGDSVWILDVDGRVVKYNAAAERLFGKPGEDIKGAYCYELMHGADRHPAGCPFLRMRESWTREVENLLVGDRWYEVSVEPLRSIDGRITGTVHISKDITDRKQSDDRIRALLDEKQLLLREVHHRIKNNMNVTISFLSLQAESARSAEARTAMENAERRMYSMMVIYDQLYRSEDYRSLSTAEYILQLLDIISRQFNAPAIRIERELDDFLLDSSTMYPLGIMLNELITNAFKYAFKGRDGGRISVSLKKGTDGTATLAVEDDGPGLPAGTGSGGGFGLVMMRGLAEQIGGTIAVGGAGGEGKPAGASFTVTFSVRPGLAR